MDLGTEIMLRDLIMQGHESRIKTLIITEEQKQLIRIIGTMDYMTTSDLCERYSITAQNASAKLNRLFVAGYLNRESRSSETGGIEYRYTSKYT